MKFLFRDRVSKEHHHTTYYKFVDRDILYTDIKSTKVLSCDWSLVEYILWY